MIGAGMMERNDEMETGGSRMEEPRAAQIQSVDQL